MKRARSYFTFPLMFLFAGVSVCNASATPAFKVTLAENGRLIETHVTDPESVSYLRQFASGQAPHRAVILAETDTRFVDDCQSRDASCWEGAQILRVEDCSSGVCAKLKGLYAGRSPAI